MRTREEIDDKLKSLQFVRARSGYFVDVVTLLHMYNFMCQGEQPPPTYLDLNAIGSNKRRLRRFQGNEVIISGLRSAEVTWDTDLSNRSDGTREVLYVKTDSLGALVIGTT